MPGSSWEDTPGSQDVPDFPQQLKVGSPAWGKRQELQHKKLNPSN